MVRRELDRRDISGNCIVDIGCGAGRLYHYVAPRFNRYIGVDVVRYDDFPSMAEFRQVDLDSGDVGLGTSADVITAVEVIEHLENPRDFMRKLVRLSRPGGWIIVTTPNQLSFLSLLTLVVRHRFQAFQDPDYPAHLTALLEVDLRRIAAECGLRDVEITYSLTGRIPFTEMHFPRFLSRLFPRLLSDNVLMIGKKERD